MKRAFISHVPEDAALAAELCRAVEQFGLACWLAPRDVAPGSEYAEAIMAGIATCPAFVLLLTAGSNRSMFVRHELEHALSLGKRIFVVRAESVVPDSRLEPLLSSATEIDVWNPPSTELRWDRLADALAALPDQGPVPVAGPAKDSAPDSGAGGVKRLAWVAAAVVLAAGAWMMFGADEFVADDAREAGADAGSVPPVTTESRSSTIAPTQPAGVAPAPAGAAQPPAGAEFAGPGYDPTRASSGAAPALAGPRTGLDAATAGAIDVLVPPIPVPSGKDAGTPGSGGAQAGAAAPALPACPRSFALIPEQEGSFDCHCDESATRDGLVWGTDHYAPESKLCRAALHAGVIEPAGGPVTVEWAGAQDLFVGTERNGVETGDERALVRSARFRGAPPPAPGPGPCPTTFAMLPASVDSFSCVCAAVAMPGKGAVWGSDVYADNSALCLAAVHAGAITPEGGPITVERVADRTALQGSERHGVTSLDAKVPARSMRFR
ncbi:MAG: TIR domain-containing protein [Limnobacter sp.]|nr:TIR domain-containing protein [Limnobacter sp.]